MGRKRKQKKINLSKMSADQLVIFLIILIFVVILSCFLNNDSEQKSVRKEAIITNFSLNDIPEYTDEAFIYLNNNEPYFSESDYNTKPFENYSELDENERCGIAYANICKEIMPSEGEERGEISSVKPTGWEQTKIDGSYLYNRCHLIGYQLAGENANELNLITGTRYFNVEGMLPFENKIADYIDENEKNHVLYRVTPIFKGENLLASGVEMEAYSVEDNGEGVSFNVFVYNVQPGVKIDYSTGKVIK